MEIVHPISIPHGSWRYLSTVELKDLAIVAAFVEFVMEQLPMVGFLKLIAALFARGWPMRVVVRVNIAYDFLNWTFMEESHGIMAPIVFAGMLVRVSTKVVVVSTSRLDHEALHPSCS